ncbi:MAG: alanine--tRNA ligase [Bacteroidales bacterium]
MMNSRELRQSFFDFFSSKQHTIVPSAPMVIKNDPTLLFTNAGMNQFKDIFLDNAPIISTRIADSQKCLRVSGKHNDLEEVGHDTYHHTMFEMLGNWSFGDYFKKEAIAWAWEYLTDVLNISPDLLYATVFEGDSSDGTDFDQEAYDYWCTYLPEDRILKGNKKDNFWEMGETGPCGPCSEIHVDIRSPHEQKQTLGRELVNKDHPQVIEIWNLVFMQFNRKANGALTVLPKKHIDTGMGFERLAMIVQQKQSNYDTDIFQPLIQHIGELSHTRYGNTTEKDIAMRVIADHIRTIAFAVADGQLPSNIKAGYVIRRILRRAVRYGYTFLNLQEPFLYQLLPTLTHIMGEAYPELISQQKLIAKIIFEEEKSFLRSLTTGIQLLQGIIDKTKQENSSVIKGVDAFTLYDTYGFPFDLTTLIAREQNMSVDEKAFGAELEKQKQRARKATSTSTGDWVEISKGDGAIFIGYEATETMISIIKYRKVIAKNKTVYQLVFDKTPFYAEAGGQISDVGFIESHEGRFKITQTQKENNLIIHTSPSIPSDFETEFKAVVDKERRRKITANHSATHLLHDALIDVLGGHVEQKGSLVEADKLRFDFAHFQKLTTEEIRRVEQIVNKTIRDNIRLDEKRNIPIDEAQKLGAKALFGEKYGDSVRVIQFGKSIELCGGTHVNATGDIGFCKITSESAIAAGIRRIEAITGEVAENYIYKTSDIVQNISSILKNPKNISQHIELLVSENHQLKKQIEAFEKEQAVTYAQHILSEKEFRKSVAVVMEQVPQKYAKQLKDIAMYVKNNSPKTICVLSVADTQKIQLAVSISQETIDQFGVSAKEIIQEAAQEIKGGGGGQAFFATAGGKNPEGIAKAFSKINQYISHKIS